MTTPGQEPRREPSFEATYRNLYGETLRVTTHADRAGLWLTHSDAPDLGELHVHIPWAQGLAAFIRLADDERQWLTAMNLLYLARLAETAEQDVKSRVV
jgi:hypothetical protein